ncbi:MAG: hypothetical protein M1828_006276 [Chrysothrix sp. TS-e1954]|nr:MAG: hypothetical protein M1828_006276 [Chrysothrix sp. TS-e1954]
MFMNPILAGLIVVLVTTTAAPIPLQCPPHSLTAETLLQIAPTSNTCSGALFPDECRTASQAACPIASSFAEYDITHPAVQAALISLIAYESTDFKYSQNHFPAPGVPNQGTRNMQSPTNNQKYAASLGGIAYTELQSNDNDSFGSAAWFISTQCGLHFRQAMWTGSQSAYEAYLQDCVAAEPNAQRLAYWNKAMKAFGLASTA